LDCYNKYANCDNTCLEGNFVFVLSFYLGHIGPLCETCDFLGEINYFEIA